MLVVVEYTSHSLPKSNTRLMRREVLDMLDFIQIYPVSEGYL